MNTRRAILKLIGAAPAAASGAKAQIAELMASPAVAAVGALAVPAAQTLDMVGAPAPRVPRLLAEQLHKLRQQAENEMHTKQRLRAGPIDIDLAVLRSVSDTRKARIQFERDMDEHDLFLKLNKFMWG